MGSVNGGSAAEPAPEGEVDSALDYSAIGEEACNLVADLYPRAGALDLQPRHFFGKDVHALSEAQLSALEDACETVRLKLLEAKFQRVQSHFVTLQNECLQTNSNVQAAFVRIATLENTVAHLVSLLLHLQPNGGHTNAVPGGAARGTHPVKSQELV